MSADSEDGSFRHHCSALILAAQKGIVGIVHSLIAARADVNLAHAHEGLTPLYYAEECIPDAARRTAIVSALTVAGASELTAAELTAAMAARYTDIIVDTIADNIANNIADKIAH